MKITVLIARVPRGVFAAFCALGVAVGCASIHAQPAIFAQANDLVDTTPGQDLWQYWFSLSGFNFQMGQGFSVFFDPLSIPTLQATPPSVGPDWGVLSIQPDLILRQPGYYDALAVQNNPSLANLFIVDVVWQGADTPGPQPFTIYNTDFGTLFTGQTVVVPEPTISVLVAVGLAALLLQRKFNKR